MKNNGCYQRFQGGDVHWSPATGAQATYGAIRARWASLGFENGKLGYPVAGEVCGMKSNGCYQRFQGGDIHWSPATGAQATCGAIRTFWGSLGYENGWSGLPRHRRELWTGLAGGAPSASRAGTSITPPPGARSSASSSPRA